MSNGGVLPNMQGIESEQSRNGSMLNVLDDDDMGPQRTAPTNRSTRVSQCESQQVVQKALEAAISSVGSAGSDNGHMVEIITNMQTQLVRLRSIE
jgi:hypothetical protein